MHANVKEALRRAAADVLERFAFSFVEAEEDVFAEDAMDFHARQGFQGASRGAVGLVVPRALAMELGANILGAEPGEVSEDTGRDAVKELTNIICGELLPELYGRRAVFNLGVPALRETAAGTAADELPVHACAVTFSAEGYPVTAWFDEEQDADAVPA